MKRTLPLLVIMAMLGTFLCVSTAVIAASPNVTSMNPTTGARGSVQNSVLINGTNLTGATTVTFSGTGVTAGNVNVLNDTTVSITVTVAADAVLGARDLTVTTPQGGGTLPAAFTVGTFPNPPQGNTSAVGLSITAVVNGNPVTVLNVGDVVTYFIGLSIPPLSADKIGFDYFGGQLSVRFPDSHTQPYVYHPVAGYGGTTPAEPNIPEITVGSPFFVNCR